MRHFAANPQTVHVFLCITGGFAAGKAPAKDKSVVPWGCGSIIEDLPAYERNLLYFGLSALDAGLCEGIIIEDLPAYDRNLLYFGTVGLGKGLCGVIIIVDLTAYERNLLYFGAVDPGME